MLGRLTGKDHKDRKQSLGSLSDLSGSDPGLRLRGLSQGEKHRSERVWVRAHCGEE